MAVELLKRWNGTEWVLVSQVNRVDLGIARFVIVDDLKPLYAVFEQIETGEVEGNV